MYEEEKEQCQNNGFIFDTNIKHKLNIGDQIYTNNRKFIIVDICLKIDTKGHKWCYYIYKCEDCGYVSYSRPMAESNLITQQCKCACCSSTVVVPGINDITTTAAWMIPFFPQGEEQAQKYTCHSSKKITMLCPFCGRLSKNKVQISNLYANKGFLCVCKDGISYPNKFMYNLLEQLNIKFITEYSPKWIGKKAFDFYLQELDLIIEMDGSLGHGKKKWSGGNDSIGFYTDMKKQRLAAEHGIDVIRINSDYSNKQYLKEQIYKTRLPYYIDLKKVDFDLCDTFAVSNFTKNLCECFNANHCKTIDDIIKYYPHMTKMAIGYHLRKGKQRGWCDYDGRKAVYPNAYRKINQYSLDGVFIRQFNNNKELRENGYTGRECIRINQVCSGNRKTAKGYIWRFADTNWEKVDE